MRNNDPRGFTLLEIVVALMLLTIGTLGYAAVAVSFSRALYFDTRRARSSDALFTQREILLRSGCNRVSSGSGNQLGIPVRWDVAGPSVAGRQVTVAADRPADGSLRTDTLQSVLPCN